MTTELCQDVRNLIIDKVVKMEDCNYGIYRTYYYKKDDKFTAYYYLMVQFSRNMRDPENHIVVTQYCYKREDGSNWCGGNGSTESLKKYKKITTLIRNPDMINYILKSVLCGCNGTHYYLQGEPLPEKILCGNKEDQVGLKLDHTIYEFGLDYYDSDDDDIEDMTSEMKREREAKRIDASNKKREFIANEIIALVGKA